MFFRGIRLDPPRAGIIATFMQQTLYQWLLSKHLLRKLALHRSNLGREASLSNAGSIPLSVGSLPMQSLFLGKTAVCELEYSALECLYVVPLNTEKSTHAEVLTLQRAQSEIGANWKRRNLLRSVVGLVTLVAVLHSFSALFNKLV